MTAAREVAPSSKSWLPTPSKSRPRLFIASRPPQSRVWTTAYGVVGVGGVPKRALTAYSRWP